MILPTIANEALRSYVIECAESKATFTLEFDNVLYFIKTCSPELLEREVAGYRSCREFYPVPELVGVIKLETHAYLVYEYEKSISKETGLLVDFFANPTGNIDDVASVLKMYATVFKSSLCKSQKSCARIFFEDRISTRINTFYGEEFCSKEHEVVLNGQKLTVSLDSHIKKIEEFFSQSKEKWCVVSQCDPNDLNIGTKPILLDFTAGGKVPIWAEFATFFWYQLAQGGHLSLVYNPKAFEDHAAILGNKDLLICDNGTIAHKPIPLRKAFAAAYIEQVLSPIWNEIGTEGWYLEFKNYMAMRILGVFDVSKMTPSDTLLCLGYLEIFYGTLTPSHPRDLLRLFSSYDD